MDRSAYIQDRNSVSVPIAPTSEELSDGARRLLAEVDAALSRHRNQPSPY
jgi:hypothetical protein